MMKLCVLFVVARRYMIQCIYKYTHSLTHKQQQKNMYNKQMLKSVVKQE